MKVKTLIEKLQKLDGNLTVVGYDQNNEGHHAIFNVKVADTDNEDEIEYDKADNPIDAGLVNEGDKFVYLIG